MRPLRRIALIFVMLSACGSDKPRVQATPQPAAAAQTTRELDQLVERVRALATSDPDPEHERLAATLRALADALDQVAGKTEESGNVRRLALELEKSDPEARHTPLIADAIADALVAIQARGDLDDAGALAYARALRAYEQIAPGEPLARQIDPVRRALEGVANALAAIAGAPPPFEVAAVAGTPADPAALRRYANQLYEVVEKAAASRSTSDARGHLAAALEVLADAIRVAPATSDRSHVAALASKVAFARGQLERVRELSLERVDFIAVGLAGAVEALRAIANAPAGSTLATMIDRADTAVRGIDQHTPFGFARPQIQDALRAVADAYFVFATSG